MTRYDYIKYLTIEQLAVFLEGINGDSDGNYNWLRGEVGPRERIDD